MDSYNKNICEEETCAACGYNYRKETVFTDEVIRYQSGKRKGEIRHVQQKEIVFEIGGKPFIKLHFEKDVDKLVAKHPSYANWDDRPVDLLACPKCSTVKFKFCY